MLRHVQRQRGRENTGDRRGGRGALTLTVVRVDVLGEGDRYLFVR